MGSLSASELIAFCQKKGSIFERLFKSSKKGDKAKDEPLPPAADDIDSVPVGGGAGLLRSRRNQNKPPLGSLADTPPTSQPYFFLRITDACAPVISRGMCRSAGFRSTLTCVQACVQTCVWTCAD